MNGLPGSNPSQEGPRRRPPRPGGMGEVLALLLVLGVALIPRSAAQTEEQNMPQMPLKTASAFYTQSTLAKARANADRFDWAGKAREAAIAEAQPWLNASDDMLWEFVFGPAITRSWMVWSDGFCPACKQDVRMYAWKMRPWDHRWKVQCPHCDALFPTNDFEAFHRSGLDEHGVFRPERADRALLFNAAHPDPSDPLRLFGVDDGDGYVDAEGHRWRFIGAYLIYGQWKQLIVDGIVRLSRAYAFTGDAAYARKAVLMLDRVADVFPGFDFGEQGIVYERKGDRGQVSTWHDACAEMHQLALAYDRVFEGARAEGGALTAFLSQKARAYAIENPKESWEDIQRNIEGRIFRNTLANSSRIDSNFPTTDVALLLIQTVLEWPANRETVMNTLDGIITRSTAVDGVSGEKGLFGYGSIAPHTLASILTQFSLLEPDFLKTVYERLPVLRQTYRFHIDTWFMGEWYPTCGDAGAFGTKAQRYAGVALPKQCTLEPSAWRLLWNLYKLTGDVAFVQVLYHANGDSVEGLPYDLLHDDPAAFQADVAAVIEQAGAVIHEQSVNMRQWCLAMLRSGSGENARALWLDYDSVERHRHQDGMNLGLFAKGLDLIPDFGYPPVGYGGWEAPKARWYTMTPAHVTVTVDGRSQDAAAGTTTLWAPGKRVHAVRASCPGMYGIRAYERLAAMMDLSEEDFYVLDCFFVEGGQEHAQFFHSFFGSAETGGLTLAQAADFGQGAEMRNFRIDPGPAPGWWVEWQIEDRYGYLAGERAVRLRYTGLTPNAEAGLCEGWIDATGVSSTGGEWIPRVMVRRRSQSGSPLTSAFVAVIEPYGAARQLRSIRRVTLESMNARILPDDFVGVEVARNDGRLDVWFAVEGRGPLELLEPDRDIHVMGEFAVVTLGPAGPERLALGQCQWIRIGKLSVILEPDTEFIEAVLDAEGLHVVSGDPAKVDSALLDNQPIPVR